MKSNIHKQILTSIFILISIFSFAQNSNIIFEFNSGDAGLFNKDNDNNLYTTLIINNLEKENLVTFVNDFKKNEGVLEFDAKQNENNKIEANVKFKKADIDYFYELFKNNGVSAIKVNGKTTKVEYLELKTDILPEPSSMQNAADKNNIEYYEKRISDAEYKINWVQHDRNELKKAIISGWFEEADITLTKLIEEREDFKNNNSSKK